MKDIRIISLDLGLLVASGPSRALEIGKLNGQVLQSMLTDCAQKNRVYEHLTVLLRPQMLLVELFTQNRYCHM